MDNNFLELLVHSYESGSFVDFNKKNQDRDQLIHIQKTKLCELAFNINIIFKNPMKGIFFLDKEDKIKLVFLLQTLEISNNFLKEVEFNTEYYSTFLSIDVSVIETFFSIQLLIIENILETLNFVQLGGKLTNNFDILELKLRSNFEETKAIFLKENSVTHVENHIKNNQARKDWVDYFGMNVHIVQFNDFLDFLAKQNILSKDTENYEKKINYFKYFLNFPSIDVVTPYKWNLLINFFGPYENFSYNFFKIMNENGFLGLINRIQAFEILKSSPPKSLLIRMSRTESQLLAFSYKNSKGIIGHKLNKCPKTNKIVPIYKFIEENFKNYKLVPFTLCPELIFNNLETFSLSDYAINDNGYFNFK